MPTTQHGKGPLFAVLLVVLACAALSGCSSSTPTLTISSVTPTVSAPTADTVKTWPVEWCKTQPGMSRDQMRALMGTPTSEYGASTGNPQMSWSAFNYQFNAFFDVNDHVRQLDINTIALSATDSAAIACDVTRKAN